MQISSDAYLPYYVNSLLSGGDHETIFGLMLVAVARLLPIVGQAPFLGAKVLPHPVKMVLALSLWVIYVPTFSRVITTEMHFSMELLGLAAKEFFIGMLIGFFVSIPFTLMQSVGFIIDHQRGAASLMVNDPAVQNQASPIGLFYNMILIYLFWGLDGPFYLFEIINTSYELIPPDKFLTLAFFSSESLYWDKMQQLMNDFMVLSIRLASPSMIIILMTDFFLGIANRLAPQVQIIFLGLGLKSMVPIIVMLLGWYLFIEQAAKEAILWLFNTKEMVSIMGKNVLP